MLLKHKYILTTTLFSLIYMCLSFYTIQSIRQIGSTEAVNFLPRKPNIIKWKQKEFPNNGVHFSHVPIEPDSFVNFSISKNQALQLVKMEESKPTVYLKSTSRIYPLLMQPQNGAFPHLLIGELGRIITPVKAVQIFSFFCSLITYLSCLFYLWRRNLFAASIFSIIAAVSPQMVYVFGQINADFQMAFCTFALALYLYATNARPNMKFFMIGLLLAFMLYLKLSMLFLILMFPGFYDKKTIPYTRHLLSGALCILIPYLFIINFSDLQNEFYKRFSGKSVISFKDYYQLALSLYFSTKSFGLVVKDSSLPWFSTILSSLSLGAFWTFIFLEKGKGWLRYSVFLLIYLIIAFSVGSGEQAYQDYIATSFYLMIFLFLSSLPEKTSVNPQKIFLLIIPIFLQIFNLVPWLTRFQETKKQIPSEIWNYPVFTKLLMPFHQTPLITLYYENVGQFEFFSQGKIVPYHVSWKFDKPENAEQFLSALKNFDQFPVNILWPKRIPEPIESPESYMNLSPEKLQSYMKDHGYSAQVIFRLPEILRHQYDLIQINRMSH